jgi:broad specificity phosphatase PhoE
MTRFAPFLAALLVIAIARHAPAQEAIYVVRHAERADDSADSALSNEGIGRSLKLSALLAGAGVTRIFATERKRTVQTATPLAEALHIAPAIVAGSEEETLIQKVRASRSSDRVLIVGHSNTVPAILRRLGVKESITLGDTEFDNLFIVVPRHDGPPVLLRLKY